jgi:hypothetical protein
MGFYLPGIYKPFYIEGLLVHSQAEYNYELDINNRNDTLFALIDVHNGIGIYDKNTSFYNVGDVSCIFNFYNYGPENGSLPNPNKIRVYRDKPLFASSYQETISSIFYKVDVSEFTIHGSSSEWEFKHPYSIQVNYTSPVAYDTVVNRNINLSFNVNEDSGIYNRYTKDIELLYLKQDPIRSNYWNIANVERTFINFVSSATSNNVAYYVVNEAFYKYFIKPETHIPVETSLFYRTYNNGENKAFQGNDGDRVRNFCDLFPYKVRYNGDNTTKNFDFDTTLYDTTTKNCCYTKPFLRMFPALNNKLNNTGNSNTEQPGCCRIVYEGGTIKFEGNNQFVMSSSNATDPKKVNFYLICVKSPLTNNRILGNANAYDSAITKGGYLNPEQDYITYIRNYGRIKLI